MKSGLKHYKISDGTWKGWKRQRRTQAKVRFEPMKRYEFMGKWSRQTTRSHLILKWKREKTCIFPKPEGQRQRKNGYHSRLFKPGYRIGTFSMALTPRDKKEDKRWNAYHMRQGHWWGVQRSTSAWYDDNILRPTSKYQIEKVNEAWRNTILPDSDGLMRWQVDYKQRLTYAREREQDLERQLQRAKAERREYENGCPHALGEVGTNGLELRHCKICGRGFRVEESGEPTKWPSI